MAASTRGSGGAGALPTLPPLELGTPHTPEAATEAKLGLEDSRWPQTLGCVSLLNTLLKGEKVCGMLIAGAVLVEEVLAGTERAAEVQLTVTAVDDAATWPVLPSVGEGLPPPELGDELGRGSAEAARLELLAGEITAWVYDADVAVPFTAAEVDDIDEIAVTTADAVVTVVGAVEAGFAEAEHDASVPQPEEPEVNGGAADDVTDAELLLLLPPPERVGIPGRGAGRVWPNGGREGAGADAAFTPTTLAELPCRLSLLLLLPPLPETSTEEEPVWLAEEEEEARWSEEDVDAFAEVGAATPCWAIMSERSLSGSWTRPWISSCACLVASAEPRIKMVRSPWPLCFSTSMWAPEASRIALMLQPQRPITRLIAVEGTVTFLERRTTSFQPSSPRW